MRPHSALAIGCFSLIICIVLTMTLVALKTMGSLSWGWPWIMSPLWGLVVLELPVMGTLAIYHKFWAWDDDDDDTAGEASAAVPPSLDKDDINC